MVHLCAESESYSSVKDVTPEEAWNDIKPYVNHFHVFGCVAHVHVPNRQINKLDNKSFK